MSEAQRLGEILPDVMRDIQARRKAMDEERGDNESWTKERSSDER